MKVQSEVIEATTNKLHHHARQSWLEPIACWYSRQQKVMGCGCTKDNLFLKVIVRNACKHEGKYMLHSLVISCCYRTDRSASSFYQYSEATTCSIGYLHWFSKCNRRSHHACRSTLLLTLHNRLHTDACKLHHSNVLQGARCSGTRWFIQGNPHFFLSQWRGKTCGCCSLALATHPVVWPRLSI